jgi:hypothetical protein
MNNECERMWKQASQFEALQKTTEILSLGIKSPGQDLNPLIFLM